jgi:2-isopropylmalate synthase
LTFGEIQDEFQKEFVNRRDILDLKKYEIRELNETEVHSVITLTHLGKEMELAGRGNGPINSVVYAMKQQGWKDFDVEQYRSHSIGHSSASVSISYIEISLKSNSKIRFWGCGEHTSIRRSGVNALISAYNRAQVRINK